MVKAAFFDTNHVFLENTFFLPVFFRKNLHFFGENLGQAFRWSSSARPTNFKVPKSARKVLGPMPARSVSDAFTENEVVSGVLFGLSPPV